MKAYTDIEQSKKLAEILPLESADMCYIKHASSDNLTWRFDDELPPMVLSRTPIGKIKAEILPCWSLAALFDLIPSKIYDDSNSMYLQINKEDNGYQLAYTDPYGDFGNTETDKYDNFVDACYDMILKLYELKLI